MHKGIVKKRDGQSAENPITAICPWDCPLQGKMKIWLIRYRLFLIEVEKEWAYRSLLYS